MGVKLRVSRKTELPQLALIVAMFAVGVYLWPVLPERIPVHFGFSGVPDEYGPKGSVFFLPSGALILYLTLLETVARGPGRSGEPSGSVAGRLVMRVGMLVGIALLYAQMLQTALSSVS